MILKTETSTLREHQLALLQMLHEIDRVCRKHNITYTLFAGTALGAVRHGGFIPWDDDLDVIMLRPEYERFLALAPDELGGAYYLQREFSAHWPMFFTKLRKNGTACIERYIPRDPLTHHGIYVDVFPCDNLSDAPAKRGRQFLASKAVIARALYQRGYLTDNPGKKLAMQLSRCLPEEALWAYAVDREETGSRMVHSFFGASSRYEKSIYPREWFTETVLLPFEDGEFPVSAHYDELLTTLYGDYMTPTPVEKRGQKVHAEIVDLERPYTEYIGVQENMEFKEYTRCIR